MFKSTKRNTMNKAEAKLVLLNDKIPHSIQSTLFMKQVKTTRYLRKKKRAMFRYLNERGPRKSRWFSTIMVYSKKTEILHLLNELLFTILAPYHPQIDLRMIIKFFKHLSFIVITRFFEATKYYLIYLILAIFPGKSKDSMFWFEF